MFIVKHHTRGQVGASNVCLSWYISGGQDVPVVFGRSLLLKATVSTLIVCKSEVRRYVLLDDV